MIEERHRRPEFHIIRRAEDLVRRASFDSIHQSRTFLQSGPENRMREITRSLLAPGNSIVNRCRAMPEPAKLWKDEPHPVAGLASVAQLNKDAGVDGILRLHKPLEIVPVRCSFRHILLGEPSAVAGDAKAFRLPTREKPAPKSGLFAETNAGDHLISHTLPRAVPSAQRGLTSVFGMGTGGTLAVYSPANLRHWCSMPLKLWEALGGLFLPQPDRVDGLFLPDQR
jgi:hypothetical protein